MIDLVLAVKDLTLTAIYILFFSAFGHEIYMDMKSKAIDAHHRGTVNMSDYTRELTSKP